MTRCISEYLRSHALGLLKRSLPSQPRESPAASSTPSAAMLSLISIVNGAPVPAASTRSNARALAGWQAYMNQGIETGAAYANAGASGDDVLLQDLNAETADKFDGLNSGKTTAGSPAVIADGQLSDGILTAVNQLTSALGSPASSPSSAAAAVDEKASEPPHGASWQDYMMQGIQTGIEFASAGAGVASGTTDPSTDFGALSAQTADHFDALNHKGGAAAEDAAPPAEKQAEWSPSGTYNYGGAAYGQPYQQGYPQYQQQGGYQAGAQGWGQPQQAQAAASAGAAAEKKPYVPKSELGKAVGRLSVALPNAILGGLTGALTGGIQTVADTAGVQVPPPPAAVHPSDVAQSSQAAPAAAGQNDGWGEAAAAEPAAAAEDEWGRA